MTFQGVRATIFRSSHNDQLSMYQLSNSIRCFQGIEFRPRIAAKPVRPGFSAGSEADRQYTFFDLVDTWRFAIPIHKIKLRWYS